MKQKEYISRLRSKLRFRLSATELNDIISDMNEVFASGTAEGRTEGEICLSLGTPDEAARAILEEHNISPAGESTALRTIAMLFLLAFYSVILWKESVSYSWLMPFAALGMLLISTGGRLNRLTERKGSVLSVAAVVLTVLLLPILLYSLNIIVLSRSDNAGIQLFIAGLIFTALSAAALICSLISIRPSSLGKAVPVVGGIIISTIIITELYCSFMMTPTVSGNSHGITDPIIITMMYRANYLNILTGCGMMIAVIQTAIFLFRKDRFTLPCVYAIMSVMVFICKTRHILRTIDPIAPIRTPTEYIPASLYISLGGIILLAAAANVYLCRRKAE